MPGDSSDNANPKSDNSSLDCHHWTPSQVVRAIVVRVYYQDNIYMTLLGASVDRTAACWSALQGRWANDSQDVTHLHGAEVLAASEIEDLRREGRRLSFRPMKLY